jgi:predicted ester cyclase
MAAKKKAAVKKGVKKAGKGPKARVAKKQAVGARKRPAVARRPAKPTPARSNTLLHQWFDEVWNKGRKEAIDELLAPGCVIHGLADKPHRGSTPFKEFYDALRPQFSRLNINVAHALVDKDLVAARCVVTGWHAATGNPVNFGGVAIVRVKGGKIVEAWNHFDFHVMNQQFAPRPVLTAPA